MALGTAWGCSSSDTSTTAGDAGAVDAGRDGAADGGRDAEIAADAAGDGAIAQGDAAHGVVCGAAACTGSDVCCAIVSDGGATPSCLASCPAGTAIACDGPEDCTNGAAKYCCGTLQTSAGTPPSCPILGVSTECRATCTTNIALQCPGTTTLRQCHKTADCADDPQNDKCCTFTSGGQSSTFCTSALAASTGGGQCL